MTLFRVLPTLKPTGNWRLYPAEISRESNLDGRDVILEDWRIWFDVGMDIDTELPGKGLSATDCMTWAVADWIYYGSEPWTALCS